jgi:hypothetical protein
LSGDRGRAATTGLVAGYAVMIFAVVGLLRAASFPSATQIAIWVVGADVLHDFLLAPTVCLVAFALTRVVPGTWRWPVAAGVIGSAFVLAVAYPALRGFGRDTAPGNPTVLPLDYTTAVLTALAVVWGLAITWGVAGYVARSRGTGGVRRAGSVYEPVTDLDD